MTAEEAIERALAAMIWEYSDPKPPVSPKSVKLVMDALAAAGWAVVSVEIDSALAEKACYPVVYNNRGEGVNPRPGVAWQRIIALLAAARRG